LDFQTLYDFSFSILKNYEDMTTRCGLVESFSRALNIFFQIEEVKIFIMDEYSYVLKDFIKPWENLKDGSDNEIRDVFDNFLVKKYDYKLEKNKLYIPLKQKNKALGVVQIKSREEIKEENDFFKILPLVVMNITLLCSTIKDKEQIKTSSKFHQTVRNIAKITETQYELDYILPIMGEMIDGFISEHLIYIFIKNKNKKEYKLIWPNQCFDNKIYDYLEKISSKSPSAIMYDDGKLGIFPLIVDSKPYGAIVAYNHFDKITSKETGYLEEIASQAQTTISRAKSYIEVLEYATLDALTGYNNRHQFEKRLKETTAIAKRNAQPLCCIMSDIDFFKKVNDTYGHAVGDCVLKNVAKTIKKELRESDIPSRYGGEEFIFLLPQTTLKEAQIVAERLRSAVENKKINIEEYNIEGVKEISVTISIGVSEYKKTNKDVQTLYENADSALYEAKTGGRNRVVIYGERK